MESQKSLQCRLAVVKIASRCNLNCSYCYMYNRGDETYRDQPLVMSEATMAALVNRVAEHCESHNIDRFRFVFHGGEPLLAGPGAFRFLVHEARKQLSPKVEATFSVQTNGVLLTPQWCSLLRELNIRVGVSIDGPKSINDIHRVDHKGCGSYDKVRAGWGAAQEAGLEPSILTVIDIASDPDKIYGHLKELGPRSVDFLLPDATYDCPPLANGPSGEQTNYADWLLKIFSLWSGEEVKPFRIRLFDHIMSTVYGIGGGLDTMGLGENEVLVIETNGSIEAVDVLRACQEGITRTTYNVNSHGFDEAMRQEIVQLYYFSNDRLSATCAKCEINKICGGGYLPHRYSSLTKFDNPSVYCNDLMKLIAEIRNYALSLLPSEALRQSQLEPLSYSFLRQKLLARSIFTTVPSE